MYHLAAVNGTRYFYEMPHEVLRINLLTTINVLDWFSQGRVGKILFASSSETYSGSQRLINIPIPTPENVPLAIDDIYNPRFSYAASKIAGELLFIHYAKKYGFKMKTRVLTAHHSGRTDRVVWEWELNSLDKMDADLNKAMADPKDAAEFGKWFAQLSGMIHYAEVENFSIAS